MVQNFFLPLQSFSAAPKQKASAEYIERITIDKNKSSTRAKKLKSILKQISQVKSFLAGRKTQGLVKATLNKNNVLLTEL